jgi:hypothetical protein
VFEFIQTPGWTLNNNIQTHIDVYVSQDTLAVVKQAFPYLVSKEFASGSGRVVVLNNVGVNCFGSRCTGF